MRSLPKVMTMPRERAFSVASSGGWLAWDSVQEGLAAVEGKSGRAIRLPSAETTFALMPVMGRISPGWRDDLFDRIGGEDVLEFAVVGDDSGVVGLAIRAVVDEGADGDAGDQLRDAADVIGVVVGDEDVVDAGEAGGVGGGGDAVGVAVVIALPAGVDQEGLMGGSDEEGGLAAFHVDEGGGEGLGLGETMRRVKTARRRGFSMRRTW